MSDLSNFNKKVLDKYSKTITNSVFLMIQNDRELMKEYLDLVQEKSLIVVNQNLGKAIKKRFYLENYHEREEEPTSTLIQSHQKFE